jgi:hypothetical protein
MKKIFNPMHLYTLLTQETSTVFVNQLLTYQSCFQKSACHVGIKIFSNLPFDLKSLMNEKALFKTTLKWYLYMHSFYCVDEYLFSRK